MKHSQEKVIEYRFRRLLVLVAAVLAIAALVAVPVSGPWRPLLGWAMWFVTLFFCLVCVHRALGVFETREHFKHELGKKFARLTLYAIIGWVVLALLVLVAGGFLTYAIDPGW